MKRYFLFSLMWIFCFLASSGQSWQRLPLEVYGINTEGMADGKLFGDTAVIMGSYGKTFYTTDYFQSYTVDSTFYGDALEVMEFVNRDTGYIATNSLACGLLITTDAGLTFQEILNGATTGLSGNNMLQFTHSDTAYIGSSLTNFLYQIDLTFHYAYPIAPLPYIYSLAQMRVTNDSTIYLLYNQGNAGNNGALYMMRSTNYGNSWTFLGQPGLQDNGDFRMLDDTTIIVAGTAGIAKSTNGGDSFHIVLRGNNIYDGVCMKSICFPSHDTGFVVLGAGIYKTYDAGETWAETGFVADSLQTQGEQVEFITASSSQKIIVGCSTGAIYKTEDGGGVYTGVANVKAPLNFTLYPSPTTGRLKITPPINTGSNYNVEISNVLGQTVYRAYANNNLIDVSGLAAGIYLLKLEADGIIQTAKFVKQ